MPTRMDEFVIPDFKVQEKLLAERKKAAGDMVSQAQQQINEKSKGYMMGPYWIRDDDRGDLLKSATGAGMGFLADREEQAQGKQLQDIRSELLRRMPSETRTLDAIPAGNNPDEQGEQVPMREAINRNFDTEARQWGIQAGQVPGMEGMASSMFAESVKAPGRRMEKQEAREARQAELTQAQAARAAEAEANRNWREAEANRNRDDKEAARQLNAEDRAAQAREARADRAANAAAIRADKAAAVPKLPAAAQKNQAAIMNLESGLAAYNDLLADYDPQSGQAVSPTQRAALGTAFTDMQMRLKEAYELGAITGPDMRILESALSDPTSLSGTLRGAAFGKEPFKEQNKQVGNVLNRLKTNFEAQYGVSIPESARTPKPQQSASGKVGKTIVREVKLKDGRIGVEYSDGTRGYK